jgi:urea-proton symporter
MLFNDDGEDIVVQPPLPQVVGYIVVVVIGLFIATGMLFCY